MMLGPLGKPPKARKVMEKAKKGPKENNKLEKPEEILQDEDDEEEKEFNEATFARIDTQLKAITKGKKKMMPLLPFLLDSEDQVQTVENVFDYAFLIKEKAVSQMVMKETGLPVIVQSKKENLGTMESQQLVLSLNMKELKELASLTKDGHFGYDEDEEDELRIVSDKAGSSSSSSSSSSSKSRRNSLLHRTDPLYSLADAHAQAELIAADEEKSRQANKHKMNAKRDLKKEVKKQRLSDTQTQ